MGHGPHSSRLRHSHSMEKRHGHIYHDPPATEHQCHVTWKAHHRSTSPGGAAHPWDVPSGAHETSQQARTRHPSEPLEQFHSTTPPGPGPSPSHPPRPSSAALPGQGRASGAPSRPSMAWAPDGGMMVVERRGEAVKFALGWQSATRGERSS